MITLRAARISDLACIVGMLADDFLGRQRERFENPLPESYLNAFREIEADANNELIVAVLSEPHAAEGQDDSLAGRATCDLVVGTMQLTFTPSISFQGGRRCTVESVRVDERFRGRGIGREMMLWAIERAREKESVSMQLTTNNDRVDAHRFYERLGFVKSHVGMKLKL